MKKTGAELGRERVSRHRAWAAGVGVAIAAAVVAAPAVGRAGVLDPVDLALGKTATQSSTYAGNAASRAVDGNTDGTLADGSVAMTNYDAHPWWQVDLGQVREIGRVELFNRTDCCSERLGSYYVMVSDFPIADSDITNSDANAVPGITRILVQETQSVYEVPVNRSGRYVRIALTSQDYLQLAEVKVIERFNAALGRATSQSSTDKGTGGSARAVDGSVDGSSPDAVANTRSQANPWWQVDLGLVHSVREIDVWSSNTACCAKASPRKPFYVWYSTSPITGDPLTTTQPVKTIHVTSQGMPAVVPIDGDARYIRIGLDGTDALSIAEVQVWAYARGSVGAHASQSSSPYSGFGASNAIDFSRGYPAETANEMDPHLDIDLGANRHIQSVRAWVDQNSTLGAFHIFASPNPITAKTYADTVSQTWWNWTTHGYYPSSSTQVDVTARYLRIMIQGQAALRDITELEIVSTDDVLTSVANGSQDALNPMHTTYDVGGYVAWPGASVQAYVYVPATATTFATYTYIGYGSAGTTPTLTNFAAGPMYAFDIGNVTFPAGSFFQGGVTDVLLVAGEPDSSDLKWMRSLDDDGTENVFWPDTRIASTSTTPDNDSPRPYYFQSPMGQPHDPAYYDNISPIFPPTQKGFNSMYTGTSGDWVNARYYNQADLGIGRDTHCAHTSWLSSSAASPNPTTRYTGTICYVNTYSNATGDILFGNQASSLAALQTYTTPMDTVTMVIRDTPTQQTTPIFGAYSGGNITQGAPEDNVLYVNWLPNNCLSCHGGSSVSTGVSSATFLPFDPSSMTYNASPWAQADQVESFRKLNAMVLQTRPKPAVVDFINGTYPTGVTNVGAQPNLNYIPYGWNATPGERKAYTDVVKPYCRTCHMSQSPSEGGLDFLNADDLEAVRALVVMDTCKTHRMPHAQQSMKKFWTSGARAQVLGFFGRHDFVGDACTP